MTRQYSYFVYILASKKNGTLYVGVTNNLIRRVIEHKEKLVKGFTSRYNVNKLVYFEPFTYVDLAIRREKEIKKWNRKWKIELIEQENKEWKDLLYDFTDEDEINAIKEYLMIEKEYGFYK